MSSANTDINQVLKDGENSLRDFIAAILENIFGSDWITKSGVTQERIQQWEDRKKTEVKRQRLGAAAEHLLYYADLYDLRTIFKKNWNQHFTAIFGEWKRMDFFLDTIETFRDTDAHRRELLPHQKNLVVGIVGEIRTAIVRSRNKLLQVDDFFPKIECIRDNFGNLCTAQLRQCYTEMILHPGDVVEFVVTARDPQDAPLKYATYICVAGEKQNWQENNCLSVLITEKHIAKSLNISVSIKSSRAYHDGESRDDTLYFKYSVLPLSRD